MRGLPGLAALALLLLAGCAKPARDDLYVLMPDEDGKTGALTVESAGKQAVLDQPYAAARVKEAGRVEPGVVTQEEARQAFGPALAAQPARPASFVLYFLEGRDELTPESHRNLTHSPVRLWISGLEPGDAQHHSRPPYRVGEDGIVAGQASETLGHLAVHARDQLRQSGRRETVGLRHQDVDADRGRPRIGDVFDDPGEPGTRPGHWPYRRRLSSSIATITTGAARRTRGTRLW